MNYNNNKNRDEEKVFSVTMTEDELKLFSEFLSTTTHDSKKSQVDEDFLEEIDKEKKASVRARKAGMSVAGGLLGAGATHTPLGKKYPKLALATVAGGAALGYLAGRKVSKRDEKAYDDFKNKYENSDTETKAYLRHKKEKRDDRTNMMHSAIVAGTMARH